MGGTFENRINVAYIYLVQMVANTLHASLNAYPGRGIDDDIYLQSVA